MPRPFSHAFSDGGIISVNRDMEKTVQGIARYSRRDAGTWRTVMNRFLVQKDSITRAMFSPVIPGQASRWHPEEMRRR